MYADHTKFGGIVYSQVYHDFFCRLVMVEFQYGKERTAIQSKYHFPTGVMVLVVVSKLEKSSLNIFYAGVKLNSQKDQKQILPHLLPEIVEVCDNYQRWCSEAHIPLYKDVLDWRLPGLYWVRDVAVY